MKTGLVYRKYSTKKMIGEVQGFNFGIGIFRPPVMTAWCYYIDGLLIDTGIGNLRQTAFNLIVDYKPDKIALTHHHEDHSGNAAIISKALNIPVYGHSYTQKKLQSQYPIMLYQHLLWGKSEPVDITVFNGNIETNNHKFIPVHTPGHSKDHTVFIEEKKGWLFSGDLYLGKKIKFFRKDEVFSDQIASLKKVLQYDFDTIYCAHNPQLTNGRNYIKEKLDFLENFSGIVLELHNQGLSEKEILKSIDKGNDTLIKLITMKNASFENMVRSVLLSMT